MNDERFRNEFITALHDEGIADPMIARVDRVLSNVMAKYRIRQRNVDFGEQEQESWSSLPDSAREFLSTLYMRKCSEATIKNYRGALVKFFEYTKLEPDGVTPKDIRAFLSSYQERRHVSDHTIDSMRINIGVFFDWAFRNGYTRSNPSKSVDKIRYMKPQMPILTDIELENIRKNCKDIREKAMVDFLYSTGCRVSEVANAMIDDVIWGEKTVKIIGKGKKMRKVFLNAESMVSLNDYLDSRKDDDPHLFVSERSPHHGLTTYGIETIFKKIMARTNIKNKTVTCHTYRRTAATMALRRGMPLEEVQKMLGHENISTTIERYARVDMDDVRKDHERYVL